LAWASSHGTRQSPPLLRTTSNPASALPKPTVHSRGNDEISCDIDGWEKLFKLTPDRTEVVLKYFPDTGTNRRNDALLLIVFGYELLLRRGGVEQDIVHSALHDMLRNAPGSPLSPLEKFLAILPENVDFGEKYRLDGYLERNELSRGGYYNLTPSGRKRAMELTLDLVRRA
jgi:hypothetical protein